uniref:Uncharacterized protein LOC104247061 n=1 Tax=Nicotiana sylvestris TaxID=4096 RepID=A0A1U7YDV3_NICSY|nr:PREDICTED: uncharacterized protein LOC104247061 [Nicotiana sylvestris]
MNNAQVNYTVTEKELFAIVFAIEKCCPYLMGAKVIVHTDHAALHYLMSKKDYKARLMIWIDLQLTLVAIYYRKWLDLGDVVILQRGWVNPSEAEATTERAPELAKSSSYVSFMEASEGISVQEQPDSQSQP